MSVNITYHPSNQLCEMCVSGLLSPSEFASSQQVLAGHIASGHRPRVLVMLNGFEGWANGGDWNNLDFMFTHGENIAKIAIIGEKRWEDEVRMFTGAGMRPTPVGFFTADETEAARDWLLE